MENQSDPGDDLFNVVCGDLGLGESTRGSIYLNFHEPLIWTDQGIEEPGSPPPDDPVKEHFSKLRSEGKNSIHRLKDKALVLKRLQAKLLRDDDEEKQKDWEEVFPMYADIQYGTTLRQQKKLYEQQVDDLRRQHAENPSDDRDSTGAESSSTNYEYKMTVEEIDSKLSKAMLEMEELKIELDACKQRLDAKYKAVAILREQAELADTELKSSEQKASENNKRLEQEVSKLQFELEWKESSFMDSQQTWAQRFDRVCQENSILMTKLEVRNEELRRANAHKNAIARERDELLALLDVTERFKYEQGKSRIAEENYGTFSSSELAVLGACKCRMSNPDPCGCAHAAANLRKEVAKLREEIEIIQQRREEANLTADAYRIAFEEQLSKTKGLSQHLAHLATITSKTAKAKAAMKFLYQVLSEDIEDYSIPKPPDQVDAHELTLENLPSMTLQDLVPVLTDMVNAKKEALAHQKLTIHIMASKLHALQGKEDPSNPSVIALKGPTSTQPAHSKEQSSPSKASAQKQEQNPSVQKQEQNPSVQKQEQNSSEQKQEQNPSVQKQEQNPSSQKQEQNSSVQKQEQNPSAEKQEQNPSAEKQEQNPSAEKQEQNLSEQKQEQIPSEQKQEQNPSAQKQEENHQPDLTAQTNSNPFEEENDSDNQASSKNLNPFEDDDSGPVTSGKQGSSESGADKGQGDSTASGKSVSGENNVPVNGQFVSNAPLQSQERRNSETAVQEEEQKGPVREA